MMKLLGTTMICFLFLSACDQRSEKKAQTEGFVEVDDTELYYTTIGSGDTLVVLHGGPGLSHQYLKPQLDSLLSSEFTLLFYDQRGSGWSDGVENTSKLNMQTYVSDLERIRSHFNLSALNLIGHSFGGLLGMYYGINFPDHLNSLVLIDTDAASYELRTPYQIETINARLSDEQENYLDSISETEDFRNFAVHTYDKYYKTFLTSYFADPADTTHLRLGFDSISIPKIRVTSGSVRKDLGQYDIHEQLQKIQCPTLILHGRESIFATEGAEAIQQRIPNSELHLFDNCGHFEYIEAPEEFKRLVANFYNAKMTN